MIPTRSELIERARRLAHEKKRAGHDVDGADVADFALAEIRRAVSEELEALRHYGTREVSGTAFFMQPYIAVRVIDARLSALRAEQAEHDKPRDTKRPIVQGKHPLFRFADRIPPTADGKMLVWDAWVAAGKIEEALRAPHPSEAADTVSACPPPALSDADALDRAAEFMHKCGFLGTESHLKREAAKLRAPKPVDVFYAFVVAPHSPDSCLEDHARDWFGPLVAALERIEDGSIEQFSVEIAGDALAALRQRAEEVR